MQKKQTNSKQANALKILLTIDGKGKTEKLKALETLLAQAKQEAIADSFLAQPISTKYPCKHGVTNFCGMCDTLRLT